MPGPELRPGRAAVTVGVGRRPVVLGQRPADRVLGHRQSAVAHLADDTREAGQSAVVDAQEGVDLLLADPGATGFLFGLPVPVGPPLLMAREPADAGVGRDDPAETSRNGPIRCSMVRRARRQSCACMSQPGCVWLRPTAGRWRQAACVARLWWPELGHRDGPGGWRLQLRSWMAGIGLPISPCRMSMGSVWRFAVRHACVVMEKHDGEALLSPRGGGSGATGGANGT